MQIKFEWFVAFAFGILKYIYPDFSKYRECSLNLNILFCSTDK